MNAVERSKLVTAVLAMVLSQVEDKEGDAMSVLNAARDTLSASSYKSA